MEELPVPVGPIRRSLPILKYTDLDSEELPDLDDMEEEDVDAVEGSSCQSLYSIDSFIVAMYQGCQMAVITATFQKSGRFKSWMAVKS